MQDENISQEIAGIKAKYDELQSNDRVDPELCAKCIFNGTMFCSHPDGVYQEEPAGLNKLLGHIHETKLNCDPEEKEEE